MDFICTLISLYTFAIIVRIILSWFPLQPGGLPYRIGELLMRITDPVLVPIRRIMPRTGFIDLSPLVAILAIQILSRLVLGC